MKRRTRHLLSAACALAMCGSARLSMASIDPDSALRELNAWYADKLKVARETKKPIDGVALLRERMERAKEAVNAVDLATMDASKGLALAQLCQAAQMWKESGIAARLFASTDPDPARLFTAQQIMLTAYDEQEDATSLRALLLDMNPSTPQNAATIAANTGAGYAQTVADKFGSQAGLELITRLEANVPFEELRRQDDERAAAAKASGKPLPAGTPIVEIATSNIATGKADMLQQQGKSSEAESVLQQALKTVGEKSRMAESIQMKIVQVKLPGTAAPALAPDRMYGEFTGLDAYRGKVVVLDFFAHWCGPCKRGNPSMKKMYAELKDRGLEVVGVTRYYGYYKTDKNLAPEAEYGKMSQYRADEGLPWPLLFGSNDNFTKYGVSGIPHYVVIDRDGKVSSITVGYSEKLHANLRSVVEKALGTAASQVPLANR